MGDLGSIPELGRSPGGEHGNPLQYTCLENPHGQRSLVSCSPRGHKESDMTEQLSTTQHTQDSISSTETNSEKTGQNICLSACNVLHFIIYFFLAVHNKEVTI